MTKCPEGILCGSVFSRVTVYLSDTVTLFLYMGHKIGAVQSAGPYLPKELSVRLGKIRKYTVLRVVKRAVKVQ